MTNKAITLPGGAKMPVIGLGTWQCTDEGELERAMNAAFESGYRHFDTAFAYFNEETVGKVIAGWIQKGLVERKDLFITTKLPMYGVHPERVEMFMNKSLKSLGLDYIDLYLVHFPVCAKYVEGKFSYSYDDSGNFQTEPTDHIGVWKKMEEMVDAGKAKNIGLSNFNSKQISKILDKARIKPANLQVEIHPYLQNNELVDFCKDKESPRLLEDPVLVSIAEKHAKTPAQVTLRYAIQRGLAAIPKSVTPSRIKQNIEIFDFELDQNDMTALAKLDKGEEGRVCGIPFKGLVDHPEYPHKKN